ncbi:MAG: DUF4837 family protein [Rikenellaceae bacterium]|nr:DUF4837 family protein [Rikenellaceae bacterium]
MKIFRFLVVVALALTLCTSCKSFHTLSGNKKVAQGRPYELIVVATQPVWTGPLGDSLRNILAAPIPYLPQIEPEFDVLRTVPDGFKNIVAEHRNILKVLVDAKVQEAAVAVEYDLTAAPQIVLTLQGPSEEALIAYLAEHGQKVVDVIKMAERDRAVAFAEKFGVEGIEKKIRTMFGIEMSVPKGYNLAAESEDFLWARYEYPEASQGFVLYSYPYAGSSQLTPQALTEARNRFVMRIPGPSDGSYMITSPVFEPECRTFGLEGRPWVEMRGFWDVEGDFMGGPFVSYTTLDKANNRLITLDCYVYAPKLPPHKRNLLHGLEHLLHTISFPADKATEGAQ